MKAFTLDDAIKKHSKDPDFIAHYERELLINNIAKMVCAMRNKAALTQKELAKKAGTTQSVVARLESGQDSRVPSLDLLARVAKASDMKLNISFESKN